MQLATATTWISRSLLSVFSLDYTQRQHSKTSFRDDFCLMDMFWKAVGGSRSLIIRLNCHFVSLHSAFFNIVFMLVDFFSGGGVVKCCFALTNHKRVISPSH